jgi:hypothetical protein
VSDWTRRDGRTVKEKGGDGGSSTRIGCQRDEVEMGDLAARVWV